MDRGEKMKLIDLKNSIMFFDKICIYVELGAGEFKDLFIGDISDVPENILDRDVISIGDRRKGNLDIQLKPNSEQGSEE